MFFCSSNPNYFCRISCQSYKHQYLNHTLSDKATIVNLALASLHGGSLNEDRSQVKLLFKTKYLILRQQHKDIWMYQVSNKIDRYQPIYRGAALIFQMENFRSKTQPNWQEKKAGTFSLYCKFITITNMKCIYKYIYIYLDAINAKTPEPIGSIFFLRPHTSPLLGKI